MNIANLNTNHVILYLFCVQNIQATDCKLRLPAALFVMYGPLSYDLCISSSPQQPKQLMIDFLYSQFCTIYNFTLDNITYYKKHIIDSILQQIKRTQGCY